MFRDVFIQIFFRRLLTHYFAVDIYVPQAGWNLTLRLGASEVTFFLLSVCGCMCIFVKFNMPLKLALSIQNSLPVWWIHLCIRCEHGLVKGPYRFLPESLKPFANGFLSIFSLVICKGKIKLWLFPLIDHWSHFKIDMLLDLWACFLRAVKRVHGCWFVWGCCRSAQAVGGVQDPSLWPASENFYRHHHYDHTACYIQAYCGFKPTNLNTKILPFPLKGHLDVTISRENIKKTKYHRCNYF